MEQTNTAEIGHARKYRRRPLEVEAFRLGFDPWPAWFQDAAASGNDAVANGCPLARGTVHVQYTNVSRIEHAMLATRNGLVRVPHGEWIVRGRNGEMHSVEDAVFGEVYEPVSA